MTATVVADVKPVPTLSGWIADACTAALSPVEETDAAVARLDREFEKARREHEGCAKDLRNAVVDVRAKVETGETMDIDALIAKVEQAEEDGREAFARADKMLRRAERRLGRSSRQATIFRPRLARARELCLAGLEVYRDVKWQLMALRSSLAADRDGPTFDNAKELRRYLSTLAD